MRLLLLSALLSLSGCCSMGDGPLWLLDAGWDLEDGAAEVLLTDWVEGGSRHLDFTASSADEGALLAWLSDDTLQLQAQPGATGQADLTLTVTDSCDRSDEITIPIGLGDAPGATTHTADDREFFADACAVTFRYEQQGLPSAVYLAGAFNDWSPDSEPMNEVGGGVWTLSIPRDDLPDGPFPYKFVEEQGGSARWTCDPGAHLIHCEEDYKAADAYFYEHTCSLDSGSCNSMLMLEDPDVPRLWVDAFQADAAAGSLSAAVTFQTGCAGDALANWSATLDGTSITSSTQGDTFTYQVDGLASGRHTLRLTASDSAGHTSAETYLPFWVEQQDGWRSGVMYFVFLDRFAKGGVADSTDGASAALADWEGGDLQGVSNALDYLQDLGVTVLWLTNLQDNAAGTFAGDCGTYTAYHGYWPVSGDAPEEHFGDEDDIQALVDGAHARGMRVMMDWAANHVHEDHPYFRDHPDWFAPYDPEMLCDANGNWTAHPETCWFDPFLPDIWYYNAEPLAQMVEDGLWWVKEYGLDGFRVDAAKHMPHSVVWNMNARLEQEVEHHYAGGQQDFYTVGETFSDRDVVACYIGEHELDGQFDFDLYYAVRAVLLGGSWMVDLESEQAASQAVYSAAYDKALMGTFLGNHDVSRFLSYGLTGGGSDGTQCVQAWLPGSEGDDTFARLKLGFTFLFTQPGIPMIYYGDELGIPGNADPDNRHPLWWYAPAFGENRSLDLDAVLSAGLADDRQEDVLLHVASLAGERRDHPAMWSGEQVQWWVEEDVFAYGRTADDDQLLVILNGDTTSRSFTNGLAFAGLATDGVYEDLLTGQSFTASGDSITVSVPALSSRVLVLQN